MILLPRCLLAAFYLPKSFKLHIEFYEGSLQQWSQGNLQFFADFGFTSIFACPTAAPATFIEANGIHLFSHQKSGTLLTPYKCRFAR